MSYRYIQPQWEDSSAAEANCERVEEIPAELEYRMPEYIRDAFEHDIFLHSGLQRKKQTQRKKQKETGVRRYLT